MGLPVRVRHSGGAQGSQEIVRWAERGHASGSQTGVDAVGVVRPERDLDRTSTEIQTQAVVGNRRVD